VRVLVLETNLMWSVKLSKALGALGHEATVAPKPVEGEFDVVIVNLGDPAVDWAERVAELHARGMRVIAHAGHKEKELIELGRQAGCDVLATNSELTHKLADVLARASA
jgi:DNA-binding NarL/FixJ family response regulator